MSVGVRTGVPPSIDPRTPRAEGAIPRPAPFHPPSHPSHERHTMMRIPTKCSPFAVPALAACLLLSACERDEEGNGKGDATRTDTTGQVTPPTVASDSVTVAFQVTGMILVVPPTQSGNSTLLVLPDIPTPTHVAGMAFGSDPLPVCEHYDTNRGICFVNLSRWRLDGIGTAGAPRDMRNPAFPAGVLDVTRGSGNHRFNPAADSIRMTLAFRSGRVRQDDACRLASWSYTPVGQAGANVGLVNVMRWDIRHPRAPGLSLRFSPRSGTGASHSVVLDKAVEDTVRVLLAHVPTAEWDSIRANRPINPSSSGTQTHFNHYYKLLRHPSTGARPNPATHRPHPVFSGGTTQNQCPVLITGSNDPEKILDHKFFGVGTYACVVATGQG